MLESYQVEHNSQDIYFRSIVGAAEAGSRLRLGIRIRTYEPIHQVLVRLWQDQTGERLIPLETRDTQGEQKFYTAWFELRTMAVSCGTTLSSQWRAAPISTGIIPRCLAVSVR